MSEYHGPHLPDNNRNDCSCLGWWSECPQCGGSGYLPAIVDTHRNGQLPLADGGPLPLAASPPKAERGLRATLEGLRDLDISLPTYARKMIEDALATSEEVTEAMVEAGRNAYADNGFGASLWFPKSERIRAMYLAMCAAQ